MTPTCTRRLEFDSAHRVLLHESKCLNTHGHRYRLDVEVEADELDDLGRVIDFSVVKRVFGGWIDEKMDHGYIANLDDDIAKANATAGFKTYWMPAQYANPTAENIVLHLAEIGQELLSQFGVRIVSLRLYETPNCWADWRRA